MNHFFCQLQGHILRQIQVRQSRSFGAIVNKKKICGWGLRISYVLVREGAQTGSAPNYVAADPSQKLEKKSNRDWDGLRALIMPKYTCMYLLSDSN